MSTSSSAPRQRRRFCYCRSCGGERNGRSRMDRRTLAAGPTYHPSIDGEPFTAKQNKAFFSLHSAAPEARGQTQSSRSRTAAPHPTQPSPSSSLLAISHSSPHRTPTSDREKARATREAPLGRRAGVAPPAFPSSLTGVRKSKLPDPDPTGAAPIGLAGAPARPFSWGGAGFAAGWSEMEDLLDSEIGKNDYDW
jgi:hypothetical protein